MRTRVRIRLAAAVVAPAAAAVAASAGVAAGDAARPGATPKAVVLEWSRLVNAGDEEAVARLFRLPAIVEQGGFGYRLRTAAEVALWHEGLPCAGRVRSIVVSGRYATAVFVLGRRPGHRCDAPGELAAARFEIVAGKIVHWIQVAVPPRKPEEPSA
jgi:hypothetical protein